MIRTAAQFTRRTGGLLACLAVVVAVLGFRPGTARADTCTIVPPLQLVVSGPDGVGTTQPPTVPVYLQVADSVGSALGTSCNGTPLSFQWTQDQAGYLDDSAHAQALVAAPGEGSITYTVAVTVPHQTGPIPIGTAQVTVDYVDPGPSGTSISTSPIPASAEPTTLTATTTSPAGIGTVAWDFGDGTTESYPGEGGLVRTHVYRAPGDYTASVTVGDGLGKTDSASLPIHVDAPLRAALGLSASSVDVAQAVDVDGSSSTTDPSATITGWSWDFGDGAHATGATASYAYAAAGTYPITETVTDSLGRTATATRPVTVQDAGTGGGQPGTSGGPQAAWALASASPVAGTPTAFDGTASADPDAPIVAYSWSFGDGLGGVGATARHTYADGGSYWVTLTVTDAAGRSSSATHAISVGYPPPQAAFAASPSSPVAGTAVAFDGTPSSIPAPGAATYAWTFGDGATATGPAASHVFVAAGSYPVTLTVTDAVGRTSSVTHTVTPQWGATDLAVSISGSVPKAGRYTYRVTVRNLGTVGAHGIVLTNTLDPTQTLAVRASAPSGMTCGGVALKATGTLTCRAGSSAVLAPGSAWVVTFTVTQPSAPRVRMVTETSSVSAVNPDPVGADNSATRSTVLGVRS